MQIPNHLLQYAHHTPPEKQYPDIRGNVYLNATTLSQFMQYGFIGRHVEAMNILTEIPMILYTEAIVWRSYYPSIY